MRKRSKHGFTIVELVVVIAVIGILTAILIPLFVNLTGKAQEADNQSFVRNINTQLAMNEADKGFKNSVMEDSIRLAQNMGFDVTKITPYNNNDIVWDSVHDRFAIVKSDYAKNQDKEHVVYADASFDVTTPLYKLWKVYGSYEKDAQTYSIYAKETTSWDIDIENLQVGFDAGKNTKIKSIDYVGTTLNVHFYRQILSFPCAPINKKRKAFFANPYRSTNKASCKRNHEFVRYVIPKGKEPGRANPSQGRALLLPHKLPR